MRWVLLLCFPFGLAAVDLTHAVIALPSGLSRPEEKAVQMLIEEVEKRTQVRWARTNETGNAPVIRFASRHEGKPESYTLTANNRGVTIAGADARGTLFGTGRLLRLMKMERGSVTLDEPLALTASPQTPLRGHQLGYRPKTNSYDGWTLPMWEPYIRDLVVFGTNAIELIPPRSDDAADSPHFPLPQRAMMIGMSQLIADYGLDCWIWYPALDKDYGDPATVDFALKEWGEIFRALPRVDAVLVPGGDPGNTPPNLLMNLLEKQAANLRRYHPKATMWVAPQGFSRDWANDFYKILETEPAWLAGVVYGPEMRVPLARFRELVPKKYPVRLYPDITHTRHAQFPVPDWDVAFALTEGREPVNPRPLDMANIYRLMRHYTIGFIAYSEGCNDDVNKIVWSALGWDAAADITQILREYSRYFLGSSIQAQKTFARFLLDVWHIQLSRRILLDQFFLHRVLEASLNVRANLSDSGFPISILRQFVQKQLQRCQRNCARGLAPDDRKDVLSEKVSRILLGLLRPPAGLHGRKGLPQIGKRSD